MEWDDFPTYDKVYTYRCNIKKKYFYGIFGWRVPYNVKEYTIVYDETDLFTMYNVQRGLVERVVGALNGAYYVGKSDQHILTQIKQQESNELLSQNSSNH